MEIESSGILEDRSCAEKSLEENFIGCPWRRGRLEHLCYMSLSCHRCLDSFGLFCASSLVLWNLESGFKFDALAESVVGLCLGTCHHLVVVMGLAWLLNKHHPPNRSLTIPRRGRGCKDMQAGLDVWYDRFLLV